MHSAFQKLIDFFSLFPPAVLEMSPEPGIHATQALYLVFLLFVVLRQGLAV